MLFGQFCNQSTQIILTILAKLTTLLPCIVSFEGFHAYRQRKRKKMHGFCGNRTRGLSLGCFHFTNLGAWPLTDQNHSSNSTTSCRWYSGKIVDCQADDWGSIPHQVKMLLCLEIEHSICVSWNGTLEFGVLISGPQSRLLEIVVLKSSPWNPVLTLGCIHFTNLGAWPSRHENHSSGIRSRCRWYSGKIVDCHADDWGSIPHQIKMVLCLVAAALAFGVLKWSTQSACLEMGPSDSVSWNQALDLGVSNWGPHILCLKI